MRKYFLFKSHTSIPIAQFKELIDATYRHKWEIVLIDKSKGYIIAESDFFDVISVLLPLFNSDLGLSIASIATHRLDDLGFHALDIAYRSHRQTCAHLGDIVLAALRENDGVTLALARKQFKHVPHELMLTARAFIESGLNATRASQKLYIHRNTFNYRLQKFIEHTDLDIRDYHHAFYFRIASNIILN